MFYDISAAFRHSIDEKPTGTRELVSGGDTNLLAGDSFRQQQGVQHGENV